MKLPFILLLNIATIFFYFLPILAGESRIPFYEDFLEESNPKGFLNEAKQFIEETPDAIEAPRLAFDYLILAKVARDNEGVNYATSKLLFEYPQSLPTLHFISSFEKDSKTLTRILVAKAMLGDLSDKKFAVDYCRALIVIARIRGPQFLADSSLRLRANLLATKAEVEEIQKSSAKALVLEAEKNNTFSNVAKIVISEKSSPEKLSALSLLDGSDAEFASAFYLSQLTEKESKSEKIVLIQLKQALFGKPRNLEKALKSISLLPPKIAKQPDIQTFLGTTQHLDGKPELAVKTLSQIPTDSKNKKMAEWSKTAHSLANGIQFRENRKKIFLEAIGSAIEQIKGDYTTIFGKLKWENKEVNGNDSQTEAYIGISKDGKMLEIQVKKNLETIFAYRTDNGKSELYSKDLNQSVLFNSPGVFPIPQFKIERDVETGGFIYNFNLNFSSTQEKLLDEGERFFDSPYMGTGKGREIFISYLLSEKPIWLAPSKAISGGTSYPLFLLKSDSPNPTSIVMRTNLTKELIGLQFGSFSLTELSFGDSQIMKKLPDWPGVEIIKAEKFDFSLFMKILRKISILGK